MTSRSSSRRNRWPTWCRWTSSPRASGTRGTSRSTSRCPTSWTAASPFKPGDEQGFWFLDFHWSRGLTPLAATLWSGDGYCWGTQHAAESLPLPPGRGVSARFAGTHLYGSALPETDPREIGARANRIATNLPHFLQNYRSIWEGGRDELESTWQYFRGVDFAGTPDLTDLLDQGRRYHKRADGDPLRRHVPDAGQLPGLLRRLRRHGDQPQRDRQVPPGRGHQDHGDRPRGLPARHAGPRGRAVGRLRHPRAARAARRPRPRAGAGAPGSPSSTTSCRSTAGAPRPPATSACRAGSRTTRSRSG